MTRGFSFDLLDKVAVITGGGGVLCGTMARALAEHGVRGAVLDLREEAARKVAEQIDEAGGEAMAFAADVLDRQGLEEVCSEVVSEFGRVDILINGAGGNKARASTSSDLDFFDLSEDDVRWVFDLNFSGMFLTCQVFGKTFLERGEGVIVNISSVNAFRPLTRIPAYSAAKAAVSNFTQWLAVHMAQNYSTRIRVNAIAPGFFLTEQNRFLLTEESSGALTDRGEGIIAHTPMGRFGAPEDLVGTVLWLVSPMAAFVHGVVIPVDGGFSAFGGV